MIPPVTGSSDVDFAPPHVDKDPTPLPLARNRELLDGYNDAILSIPRVTWTNIVNWDAHKRVVFAAPSGSYIQQGRTDVVCRLAAIALSNGDTQQANVSPGSLSDFSGNVFLGYKIEGGEILGRVKDTMVAGNIHSLLACIAAIGSDGRWVGGTVFAPSLMLDRLIVSAEG